MIIGGKSIIIIDEKQGTVEKKPTNCQDLFVLNSWSYLEEENKVMVWGHLMIWKYDISASTLEEYRTWNGDKQIE